jgi:hypothetical protein
MPDPNAFAGAIEGLATSPQPGAPELDWQVAVERANPAQCTYWITVMNLTGNPVGFEGRYAMLT